VIAYLNDILIYLKIKEKHIKHVTAVLEVLEKANMRINNTKNVFHVQCINFLGYIFITDGVKMDLMKIAIIKNWPTPKNVIEI
jgi:Reverse transcriptase (RNA-dependent DNA polymerase)